MKEKVVLAYLVGLDTSITIPWLKENYDLDVIAVCANVGQDDDMSKIEKKQKQVVYKSLCWRFKRRIYNYYYISSNKSWGFIWK